MLTPKMRFPMLPLFLQKGLFANIDAAKLVLGLFLFSSICPALVGNAAAASVRGTDSLGVSYAIDQRPQRVVSLVPEITEILIAIDAADALVGITQHTNKPEVAKKKRVGGFLSPDIDKIESLNPDLILAADLQEEVRDHFRGKCSILTLNVFSIEDAMERLTLLGRIFEREEKTAGIIAKNQAQLDRVARMVAGIPVEKRQRTARLMGFAELLVPGDNSFQNDYIRAAGAIAPVFGKKGQAVTITLKEWQSFDPQVVYYCGSGELPEVLSTSGMAVVSAVRNKRIYSFSCNLTCRAGVNIGNFVSLLADRIYGEEVPGLAKGIEPGKPASCVLDEE